MLVPTVRTTCTNEELAKNLIKSWKKLFSAIPSKQSICILMAQHSLETGSNSCWNWNLGNIKYVTANGNVDWCALSGVWEIVNGKKVMLSITDPGSRFRSFPTLYDGATFYLQFVSGKRYKAAWSAVVAGDPAQFSHFLKVAGYYTADETQYTNSVNAYFKKYMALKDYENAIKGLELEDKPVEKLVEPPVAPPQEPAHEVMLVPTVIEVKPPEVPVVPPVDDKIAVSGLLGIIYKIINLTPWGKIIEWLGKLFKK